MNIKRYIKQLEHFGILKKDVKCYSCKHINDNKKCKNCSGEYLDLYTKNDK